MNRGQQEYDRAGDATRQDDRTEPTAYQGPVVQSIDSLTTAFRRHIVKNMLITCANIMSFLFEKCEFLLKYKRLSHFPTKNNRVFVIFTFENLTKR